MEVRNDFGGGFEVVVVVVAVVVLAVLRVGEWTQAKSGVSGVISGERTHFVSWTAYPYQKNHYMIIYTVVIYCLVYMI